MKRILDNPKPVVYAIVLFLVLAFSYRACSADDGYLEIGPTFTGGFNGGVGLMYSERVSPHWDFGLHLIGEQTWNGAVTGNNGGLTVSYVFKRPDSFFRFLPDEMHLGPAVWIETDDRLIGCQLGYNLGIRYRLGSRFHLGIRHWSNAGVCKPNRGQDLLVLGARF